MLDTFFFGLDFFIFAVPFADVFFKDKTGNQGDTTTLDREKLHKNKVGLPIVSIIFNLIFFLGDELRIFNDDIGAEDHLELHLKTPDVVFGTNLWVNVSTYSDVVFVWIVELYAQLQGPSVS